MTGASDKHDDLDLAVLAELAGIIHARRGAEPDSSYTASLIAKGIDKCAQKMGEEAIETIVAAIGGDRDHLAEESADLIYHWLVLLEAADVPLDAVLDKLRARQGIGGHVEKSARGQATV